jgi:hypothetical protein
MEHWVRLRIAAAAIACAVLFSGSCAFADDGIKSLEGSGCQMAVDKAGCAEGERLSRDEAERYVRSGAVSAKLSRYCVAYADYVGLGYGALVRCIERELGERKFDEVFSTADQADNCASKYAQGSVALIECKGSEGAAMSSIYPYMARASDKDIRACYASTAHLAERFSEFRFCIAKAVRVAGR